MSALPVYPDSPGDQFRFGATMPARGALWLLRRPALWPLAILPIALTLLCILVALFGAVTFSDDVLQWFWVRPRGIAEVGWALTHAALMISMFIAGACGLWILGQLAAGPFFDRMAELVEIELGLRELLPFDLRTALRHTLRSALHSVLGLGLWIAASAIALVLNLVPGFGSMAYVAASMILTALFLGREMLDIPLSRDEWSFRRKWSFVRDHRWACLGLGGTTGLLLAIPGVDLLVLPCSILGATLMSLSIRNGPSLTAGHEYR